MVSDIIIVVMLILFTLIGALRGFLRTILNLVAAFFSALIANWLSAPVGTWFYTTFVRQSLLSNLEHEITQSGFSGAVANSLRSLPDWVANMVSTAFAPLGVSMDDLQKGVLINDAQAQQIARSIEEPIGKLLTALFAVIAAIILFVVLLLVLKLVVNGLIRLLRGGKRTPGGIDRFFGGLFGFAEGILIVLAGIHIVYMIMSLCNPAISDDPTYFGTLFNTLCIFR